ncbi:MAG: ScyD/ScyE family protein [Vicinamibacterales bacterium]
MHCKSPVSKSGVRHVRRVLRSAVATVVSGASLFVLPTLVSAQAVCPVTQVASDLQSPLSLVMTPQRNLLVAESGDGALNTGRISIVGLDGIRRTLLAGLPSGLNDVGSPSGPAGLALRGRTLFALMGVGDSVQNATVPGQFEANPEPASPLFSSILAIHFSAHLEQTTMGYTLSLDDQHFLATGGKLTLSQGGGEGITVELVADFPDYTPLPTASVPDGVRGSNPFALVALGNQLFVTDGAQNQLRQVDIATGAYFTVASFAGVPNPLPIGPPVIEPVPTGIAAAGDRLLVTLFSGVPFAPGTSSVVEVDPATGEVSSLISDLTTAIGILPVKRPEDRGYLVLQLSSGPGLFFSGPGLLLRAGASGVIQTQVIGCLTAPTAMALDPRTGAMYVTDLTGRIVAIAVY